MKRFFHSEKSSTDSAFNPLVLFGKIRDKILDGGPRALTERERDSGLDLGICFSQIEVTGSDTASIDASSERVCRQPSTQTSLKYFSGENQTQIAPIH